MPRLPLSACSSQVCVNVGVCPGVGVHLSKNRDASSCVSPGRWCRPYRMEDFEKPCRCVASTHTSHEAPTPKPTRHTHDPHPLYTPRTSVHHITPLLLLLRPPNISPQPPPADSTSTCRSYRLCPAGCAPCAAAPRTFGAIFDPRTHMNKPKPPPNRKGTVNRTGPTANKPTSELVWTRHIGGRLLDLHHTPISVTSDLGGQQHVAT